MELEGVDEALHQANELVSYCRERGDEVIFIQHISTREGATFFSPGTAGVALHNKLNMDEDIVITKNYPNSFRGTNLQQRLDINGVKELIICGAMTHMCIESTVRAGFDLGYKIILAGDACATRALTYGGQTLKAREVQLGCLAALDGIFCQVKTVSEIIT